MNNIPLPGGILLIIIAIYYGFYLSRKAREKEIERRERLNETRKAYWGRLLDAKIKNKVDSNKTSHNSSS